jgi:hypothetical protein
LVTDPAVQPDVIPRFDATVDRVLVTDPVVQSGVIRGIDCGVGAICNGRILGLLADLAGFANVDTARRVLNDVSRSIFTSAFLLAR